MSFADAGNTVAKQPGATSYAIIDQDTVTHLQEVGSDIGLGDFIPYHAKLDHLQAELDEDVAAGRAWKGDSIEALAVAVGLDPAVLAATVAEYDEACDEGVDPLFFKPAAFLRPVRTAPFYAIEMTGSVLVSCGGIRVNGNLQVVGKDDAPIPGLYAVGMEASGLYGDTYNLDVPGTANAGDIMRGMDLGLSRFKFFPAATSGGIPALKALAGPFGTARFCPTGGISAATAPDWLALDPVLCVGGSWVVPAGPLDPARIETLAREAAALKGV